MCNAHFPTVSRPEEQIARRTTVEECCSICTQSAVLPSCGSCSVREHIYIIQQQKQHVSSYVHMPSLSTFFKKPSIPSKPYIYICMQAFICYYNFIYNSAAGIHSMYVLITPHSTPYYTTLHYMVYSVFSSVHFTCTPQDTLSCRRSTLQGYDTKTGQRDVSVQHFSYFTHRCSNIQKCPIAKVGFVHNTVYIQLGQKVSNSVCMPPLELVCWQSLHSWHWKESSFSKLFLLTSALLKLREDSGNAKSFPIQQTAILCDACLAFVDGLKELNPAQWVLKSCAVSNNNNCHII